MGWGWRGFVGSVSVGRRRSYETVSATTLGRTRARSLAAQAAHPAADSTSCRRRMTQSRPESPRPPSRARLLHLAERQNELVVRKDALASELAFLWPLDEFWRAARRNAALLGQATQEAAVRRHLQAPERLLTDIQFHLANYTASLVSVRDFLFAYAKANFTGVLLSEVERATLAFKDSAAQRALNCLRNRRLHGASIVAGVSIVTRTAYHRGGRAFVFFVRLTDQTLDALQDATKATPQGRAWFDATLQAHRSKADWLNPLLVNAQLACQKACENARSGYTTAHSKPFTQYEATEAELAQIAQELARANAIAPTSFKFGSTDA